MWSKKMKTFSQGERVSRDTKILFKVFDRNLHVEEALGSMWGTKEVTAHGRIYKYSCLKLKSSHCNNPWLVLPMPILSPHIFQSLELFIQFICSFNSSVPSKICIEHLLYARHSVRSWGNNREPNNHGLFLHSVWCKVGNKYLTKAKPIVPGEGNGNPLQDSCLRNPNGQRGLLGRIQLSSWTTTAKSTVFLPRALTLGQWYKEVEGHSRTHLVVAAVISTVYCW